MYRFARTLTVMLVAAITSMVAGCQPSSPSPSTPTSPPASPSPTFPSPAPTPTYLCTPEAGGETTPCSQRQYDEMKAKDALYAEAEAVFREFFAENIRISREGGLSEPTDVILATTSGAYLEDAMTLFRRQLDRGTRAKGADPDVVKIQRLVGQSKGGSVVALEICVDATGWGFYKEDKRVTDGIRAVDKTYFAKVDARLKMIGADGREVESCG